MGQHERASTPPPDSRGFWATLRFIARLPRTLTLSLLGVLTGFAVLAVHVGDAYGEGWGGFVGIVAGPLICSLILRVRMSKRSGP